MDVSDRVTRLECSAPRERRYATKARSPVSRSLPLRPGGVYAKPLVPDHRPRLGGPPFFARGFIPSSAWSVSGSRRTSSVGRGCEALPLWPRWERRGDSLTQKCVHHRGVSLSLSSGSRVWPSVVVSLTKQVVVGSFLLPLFTWLILPVVICLSQRLSHASVSTCRQMAKPRTAH